MLIPEVCLNTHRHLLCPPLKKRGHIVLHLSVGRSDGRSVDHLLSAQYLKNRVLDSNDISYIAWALLVDDPY